MPFWLQLFIRWSSQDPTLTLPFTVPTVISLTSLLRQGEGLITSPHDVTLVFGALQMVPLDHLSPLVYQSTFLVLHEALFAIIQCHPQVWMKKQVLVVVLITLNSKGAFEQTPSLHIKKMQLYWHIENFHIAPKLLCMDKCSRFNASSLDVSLKIGLMRVWLFWIYCCPLIYLRD